MTVTSYILGILASALVLGVVIELLRRKRLRERHAIWWFAAGVAALVVSVFPGILDSLAQLAGIEVPTNLVFFVSIAVLFLVCLQYGSELTKLENAARNLAESAALHELHANELEGRVASLEERVASLEAPDASPGDRNGTAQSEAGPQAGRKRSRSASSDR